MFMKRSDSMVKKAGCNVDIIIANHMHEAANLGRQYGEEDPKYRKDLGNAIQKAIKEIKKCKR